MAPRSLKHLTCLLAFALAALPASPQNDAALTSKLQQSIAGFHGKVSLYAKDLATGQTVSLDADQPVPTASVIKLTVLYTALQQIRSGRVHFDDKLTLRHQDQVPGSGVLLFLDTPLTLTLKDALTLMIAVSDNTATNLVIDHLGLKAIDDEIAAPPPTGLGLHNTWLYKKVYQPAEGPEPADQPQFGLGKTTAREMALVMERFVTCGLGPRPGAASSAVPIPSDQDLCAAAMHMLKVQQDREMIPRYLEAIDTSEKDSAIADKIGTLDHVRNDVGAVYTRHGTIIISAFTHDNADTSWTPDNQAELLIASMAKTIVDAWVPGAEQPREAK
ncbi:MAG TPA: serine hydrolase [Acidobacteriaceae bacterium]|jgi:beta-lactamase class A|nr:serine hydrolase [Acidobacteriaceae bacterium]